MKIQKPFFCFVLLILHFFTTLNAQLNNWNYRMPFEVSEVNGTSQTNYQVKLTINTAALVSAGHMQSDGADIRFADSCGTTLYNHYIDSNMNATNTTLWVMVPSLPALGVANFYMYYGNPTATQGSNFANTFPAANVITSNTNITGTINADWFEITAGDTAFITAGTPVVINARNIIIRGTIQGNGRGYQGPAINTVGTGPGGGGTSTNSGCGGGSYGGVGGTGGMDAGDTPGTGGASYGTNNGTDNAMGSSGGSGTGISTGGNGGGALSMYAEYISILGDITANGNTAAIDGTGRGGGGGAGGGILLDACILNFTGTISANGGNGGAGTSAANDSGGGGGGGRIKGFYSGATVNTGTATANNGTGGPNGTAAPGQPGTPGTVYFGSGSFYMVPLTTTGAEENISLSVTYSDMDLAICSNENLTATANTGFSNYDFSLNAITQASGATNAFTFTNLNNNDSIGINAVLNGCLIKSTGAVVTVNALPAVDAGVNQNICMGDSVVLYGSGALTYSWNNGVIDSVYFTPTGSLDYILTGTDVNGCVDVDTTTITTNQPNVSAGADQQICNGTSTLLVGTGALSYTWDHGVVDSVAFTPSATDTYIITGTDGFGCTDMDTVTIDVITVDVSVTNNDPTLVANAVGATYQWFNCNGGFNFPGATSASFSPSQNGNYGVIVTQSGCADTSSCNFIFTVSIDEQNAPLVTVYPNPSSGFITLQGSITGNFVLVNELGQPISYVQLNEANNYTARLDFLQSGVYFIQSADVNNKYRAKIIVTH
jgi:hypothetical protein